MDPLYTVSKVMEVLQDPDVENQYQVTNRQTESSGNIKAFEWEVILQNKKQLKKDKEDIKRQKSWRAEPVICRSPKSRQTEHSRPISRSRTSKSSLSLLLKNASDTNRVKTKQTASRPSTTDMTRPHTRVQSDSFVSNEAFYIHEKELLNECNNKFMKDRKLHKNASMSVLEQANKWTGTLRQGAHLKSAYNSHKSSKRMLFDLNNNSNTSKLQFKRVKKTKTKVKQILPEERQWLKIQSNHWRRRRGYVSSTTAPVGRDDFHRLFTAFQIASKHKSRNNEAFISDKDIKNIALRLGVQCSDRDARKMADTFDEDGSRHVTFPEMINVMNRAKASGSEPLLGSGITLQQLLIANKRRYMLEDILRQHKKHNALNSNMTERKQSFANSFGANRSASTASTFSSQARRTKMKDIQVNVENTEGEEFLRRRQLFDGKTRKAFLCQTCNRDFDYSHIFEAHKLERHEYKGKFFTCYQCSEKWIPIAERGSHMMTHKTGSATGQKTKLYGKNESDQNANFQNQSALDRFKCQYCKLVFPSRGVLSHHHAQEHRPLSLDIFRCTYCDDSFDTYEKVLKHKKHFHTNIKAHKSAGSRSGVGQEFMDAIAQLDDYDSDNDMSPEEFQEMSQLFYKSESRRTLKQRVSHLGHILNFRATYDMPDRTVDKLKGLFDKHDEKQKTKALQHVTSLLTSKFTEVVTEDVTDTFTETITNDMQD